MSPLDPKVWGTRGPLDNLKKSHIARARKRTVRPSDTRNFWFVDGEPDLNDTFDFYEVDFDEETNTYFCSCQTHAHGEFRNRCTHKTGVIIYREEIGDPDKWAIPRREEVSDRRPISVSPPKSDPWGSPSPGVEDDDSRRDTSSPGGTGSGGGEVIDMRDFARRKEFGTVQLPNLSTIPEHEIPSPTHPIFGSPPLPPKFTKFYEGQWVAVKEILGHLNRGVKVVILDAPTGSGKTLIAEVTRRLFSPTWGSALYMCSTKTLQDQVLADFPYANTIKGRSNYGSMVSGTMTDACDKEDVDGPVCERCPSDDDDGVLRLDEAWTDSEEPTKYKHCYWCHPVESCAYTIAKHAAMASPLPVLNTAYYLNETDAGWASAFLHKRLAIIDEADSLEHESMRYIEYTSTPGSRRAIGVDSLPKKTVEGDWKRWLKDDVLVALKKAKAKMSVKIERARARGGTPSSDDQRRFRSFNNQAETVEWIVRHINEGWVLTGYEGKEMKNAYLTFKPVKIGKLGREALWDKADHFLLMSATFVSPEVAAHDMGLEEHEWVSVTMDSSFPAERRHNYYTPVAAISQRTKDVAWPKVVAGMDQIIEKHPGKRILVHTVSYSLTKFLYEKSTSDRVMTYWSAQEREAVLDDFKRREDGVLLAPSFERGIDLPHDLCRVVVVAKVPFPYIGDKQIKRRMYMHGGRKWYIVETIRAIVQMTGRAMRSKDDFCETYILDGQFGRVYRDWKRLFPAWWKEALVMDINRSRHRNK